MLSYSDFSAYFRKDECEKIKEIWEEFGPFTVLSAAASYANSQRKVSTSMTRTIVQKSVAEGAAYHAIWMLSEMISGDDDLVPERPVLEMLMRLFYAQAEEMESSELKSIHQRLVEHIGTCPDPEFEQFLSYISVTYLALKMPDGMALVTLERAKRRLKDDRAFFLVLQSAVTMHMLEGIVAEVAASQAITEMTVDQLQKQGYKVKKMPGAFAVEISGATASQTDQPTAETSTTAEPTTGSGYYSPRSGTEWAAQHPRRNYGRRRKR